MKRLLLFIFLFVTVLAFAQVEQAVPNAPVPPKLVNDFTGHFISSAEKQALENKLVAFDDSTSSQIAVVIVDNLGGYTRDEYAVAIGRKWGVGGQKQFSNGVVLLVNTGEKGGQRGTFIATGYGLEGSITDLIADQIVQNILIPNFKAGNNYQALDEATNSLMDAAAGRYQAPDDYHQGKTTGSVFGLVLLIFIIFIIIVILKNRGGGGGGYVSRRGYRDNWGGPVIFPGGWSGGGGGGGWSGGGGGGFGGFGGGSFGGGGAGGSW